MKKTIKKQKGNLEEDRGERDFKGSGRKNPDWKSFIKKTESACDASVHLQNNFQREKTKKNQMRKTARV